MQAEILSVQEHGIPRDSIDPDALTIIEKLQGHGFVAYLVGGGVRDLLAGIQPKDFDISTSARPEEIKEIFRRQCLLIGRRFRLAHIRFGRKVIEVSTFRSGDTSTSGELIVQDNTWGTPEEDVLRRDFTINGLFYDPKNETVIDFVGGSKDIKTGILKCIGEPELRFRQDPVRIIRLLKFQARFGFKVSVACKRALECCTEEITKSSPARVMEEMFRMLESGASSRFFALLQEHGILKLLVPKVADFIRRHPKHHGVYDYLSAADAYTKGRGRAMIRSVLLSCLIYPLVQDAVEKLVKHTEDDAPHMGRVIGLVNHVVRDTVAEAFAHVPRRIRLTCAGILIHQYRLTPLGKRKIRKSKIVQNPDFIHSLEFLSLRVQVKPSLSPVYDDWKKYRNTATTPAKKPRRRRAVRK